MKFMAPDRQDQLTKAAEDCIDLINIGVAPTAALCKVADDHIMNDKEITLVSHAVNNARQLAHIQDNKDDERIAPLVLTNAEEAIGLKTKEQTSQTTDKLEAKQDMKDAVDTKKTLDKTAHLKLANTRKRTQQVKVASSATAVVTEHPVEKTDEPDIFDKLAEYDSVLDDARRTSNNAKDLAFAGIEKIANAFRAVDAPKFAEFEKIAGIYEISPEIVDMIYEIGNLEEIGHRRNLEKTAGARVYTSTAVKSLVEDCVHVDTNYKTACDYLSAYEMLKEQRATEVAEFVKKAKDSESPIIPGYSGAVEAIAPDKESYSNADVLPYKLTGLGSRGEEAASTAAGIFNTDLDADVAEPVIKHEVRQSIENSKARSNLENLLRDRVVGSFPIPDVVDSYNRAISLNPRFGEAELTAFIRHDLSSGGNVPLDLMIKATKSHGGAKDDSE